MLARILIGAVRLYQLTISSWTPSSCRFTPSCSAYAIEAMERFGALRGSVLALFRIARCNPLCEGGLDPVPAIFPRRPWRRAAPAAGVIPEQDDR